MAIALVILQGPNREVLLLKRAEGSDEAGTWGLPGGKIEEGENPAEAAERELNEELGPMPYGALSQIAEYSYEGQEFFLFKADCRDCIAPTLNEEHTEAEWVNTDPGAIMPAPLHPGLKELLAKVLLNEYQIAQAMMKGELPSPQFFHNIAFYDLRITGTGVSYRPSLDEIVYRQPDNYLTEEFLQRCNGLPVIWEHPESKSLNHVEFKKRNIGSITIPYIKGEEVWGIARIYDMEAAAEMADKQLSTSPGVLFRPSDGNTKELHKGRKVLIEGTPSLLDHLAVCERGVWDKGGEPTGVNVTEDSISTSGGSTMPDEVKEVTNMEDKEAAKEDRNDADSGSDNIDMLLKKVNVLCDSVAARMDAMAARMDAMESSKKDAEMGDEDEGSAEPEEEEAEEEAAKADAARKDKMRMDAEEQARKDRERLDAALKRVDESMSSLPKADSDADYAEQADEQAKADAAYAAWSKRAPPPLRGESTRAFRIRLARDLAKHSEKWKDVPLSEMPDSALNKIVPEIYADAIEASRNPNDVPVGTLREITVRDRVGRPITSFVGDPAVWMSNHRMRPARLARPFFNKNAGKPA